jgi:putative hydrolase of the HAD superfamily
VITVVTFDLWNTLLSDMNADETRVGYLLQTLTDHGVSRDHEAVRAAYDAAHAHAHRISVDEEYRHVSCWERLAFILQRLRVDLPRAVQQSIVTNWEETILEAPPPLVQDAVPVLTALNPDYRLGIISDTGITPGRVLRRVLEAAQVLRFFRATVFSDETGYNKPHRRMFETALAALEGTPSEALHIGDLLETDVAGAHCMGMTTMWLNRGGPRPTRQYEPDFEVSSLPDLLDVLTAIQ